MVEGNESEKEKLKDTAGENEKKKESKEDETREEEIDGQE